MHAVGLELLGIDCMHRHEVPHVIVQNRRRALRIIDCSEIKIPWQPVHYDSLRIGAKPVHVGNGESVRFEDAVDIRLVLEHVVDPLAFCVASVPAEVQGKY